MSDFPRKFLFHLWVNDLTTVLYVHKGGYIDPAPRGSRRGVFRKPLSDDKFRQDSDPTKILTGNRRLKYFSSQDPDSLSQALFFLIFWRRQAAKESQINNLALL